jgi:hypothetical protein
MSLFFPSSKPKPSLSSGPAPRDYGHVTKRELEKEVLGRLRRDGLNERERAIVEAAAEGHMDQQGLSRGMNLREKEELMGELREDAGKLGLERKDIDRIDDAFNRAL